MIIILSALVSLLSFRFRGRASLELELIALRPPGDRPAAPAPGTSEAFPRRPAPLGVALPDLATGLARHGAGQAGNRAPVASQRLSTLLAMEVRIRPSGTAQDAHGDPRSDPQNEHRQSSVGCAPDPRRAAQARYRSEPSHRRPIHALATRSPVPDLAQFPAQPHE